MRSRILILVLCITLPSVLAYASDPTEPVGVLSRTPVEICVEKPVLPIGPALDLTSAGYIEEDELPIMDGVVVRGIEMSGAAPEAETMKTALNMVLLVAGARFDPAAEEAPVMQGTVAPAGESVQSGLKVNLRSSDGSFAALVTVRPDDVSASSDDPLQAMSIQAAAQAVRQFGIQRTAQIAASMRRPAIQRATLIMTPRNVGKCHEMVEVAPGYVAPANLCADGTMPDRDCRCSVSD